MKRLIPVLLFKCVFAWVVTAQAVDSQIEYVWRFPLPSAGTAPSSSGMPGTPYTPSPAQQSHYNSQMGQSLGSNNAIAARQADQGRALDQVIQNSRNYVPVSSAQLVSLSASAQFGPISRGGLDQLISNPPGVFENQRVRLTPEERQAIVERSARGAVSPSEFLRTTQILQSDASSKALVKEFEKFFNKEGILSSSKWDSRLEPSPLETRNFSTPKQSVEGELVRRVANDLQVFWINSQNLNWANDYQVWEFTNAAGLIGLADKYLKNGNADGFSLLGMARLSVDTVQGFSTGVVNGAIDLIRAVPEMYIAASELSNLRKEDPVKFNAVMSVMIPTIKESIVTSLLNAKDTVMRGSARERSELVGYVATQLLGGEVIGASLKAVKAGATAALAVTKMERIYISTAPALGRAVASGLGIERMVETRAFQKVSEVAAHTKLSPAAKEYMLRQVAYQDVILDGAKFSQGELGKMGQLFMKTDEAMAKAPKSQFKGEVYRSIIEKGKNGIMFDDTHVFGSPEYNRWMSQRYSGPGDAATYASTDILTTFDELGKRANEPLRMTSQQIESTKVLDLTNKKIVQNLGILEGDLKITNGSERYFTTQILGSVARKHGFDYIKAPSIYGGVNVIGLRGMQ